MKIPHHLAGHRALGIQENEPVAQFEIGNYQNFVYLILDWHEKKAAIVDPQYDVSSILEGLKHYGFQLTQIFLTHTHHDHTAGVPELVRLFPSLPILSHRGELHRLDERLLNQANIKTIHDGDAIAVGKLTVQVLFTPGHSAGECCFLLENAVPHRYLFTGDTLFIRDCGRTDLGTGNNNQMFSSIQRIKRLSPETIFLPGHHYKPECATTLARELTESPPFQCKTVEELAALP